MKRISALILTTLLLLGLAGCQENGQKPVEPFNPDSVYYADIVIENYGTITVKLDQSAAPVTVENFVKLARQGYYDGLTFHRIIEGFMMQGGAPKSSKDKADNIVGEFSANGYDNPLEHTRGAISMARSNDPDSGGSQFFIVHEDSEFLDGNYAAFGHVTEGLEVLDAVASVPTYPDDSPSKKVVIKKMTLVK